MFLFFSVLHFLFFIALYLGFLRPPLELHNERIFLVLTAQFLFVKDDCFRRWQLDSLLFDVSFCHKKEAIFVFISSSLFLSIALDIDIYATESTTFLNASSRTLWYIS